jgi:hypothetical protein
MTGTLFLLADVKNPGWYKFGYTTRDVNTRIEELDKKHKYEIIYTLSTPYAQNLEINMRYMLTRFNVKRNDNRKYYKISDEQLESMFRLISVDTNDSKDINTKKSSDSDVDCSFWWVAAIVGYVSWYYIL